MPVSWLFLVSLLLILYRVRESVKHFKTQIKTQQMSISTLRVQRLLIIVYDDNFDFSQLNEDVVTFMTHSHCLYNVQFLIRFEIILAKIV